MSCFDKVAIELQWVASYIWWVATNATCPLALTTYKYSELQVSCATQKQSYKASCKTHCFLIVVGLVSPMNLIDDTLAPTNTNKGFKMKDIKDLEAMVVLK